MSFDWEAAASGEGGGSDSPKMEPGYHKAKCVKVMRETKKSGELKSKAGDPQLLTIWQNAQGEEATCTLTLTEKAGFVLAKLLSYAGADLARMKEAGVTPASFEKQEFAEKNLLNRECWINAFMNGQYLNIGFVKEDDVPPQFLKGGGASDPNKQDVDDDEIPF